MPEVYYRTEMIYKRSIFMHADLEFWYGLGPGNPTSAAQGIGYVQELIARLTQTPITQFNTTTNSTITNSNVTFPLNQPIFVDATHDRSEEHTSELSHSGESRMPSSA